MLEERKQKEIEYYDRKAEEILKNQQVLGSGDFEGFNPNLLSSFAYCYKILGENCENKLVLDYGCGNGIHSIPLVKMGAKKVFGIDLSEKSLKIVKERVRKEGLEEKIEFLKMDCEKIEFPDKFFDIIFDGGTFSSLDIKKAFPELARVLKPDGLLIGIETFGHNPLTNLKRKINKLTGKRTEWAAGHIFRMEDLETVKNYFNKIDVNFFHLISWITFPFLGFPGAKILLKISEAFDKILSKFPFLQKYAFKVVFVFSEPKKQIC